MDVPDPAQPNALVDVLQKLANAFEQNRGSLLLLALAVVLVVLTALDGMFKHFRTVRAVWKGVRVSGGYFRDLFTAPLRVRKLEEWRSSFASNANPVHHLGAVWFPSDVIPGRSVAFCQHCWAEGKRIALDVNIYQERAYMYCRRVSAHGSSKLQEGIVVPEVEYDWALEHVLDMRIGKGA